jgi:hypothetical protein
MSVLEKVSSPEEPGKQMLVEANWRLSMIAQIARVNAVVHAANTEINEVLENILSLATNGGEGHLTNEMNIAKDTIEIAHIIASRQRS